MEAEPMALSRRIFLQLSGAAVAAPGFSRVASAQDYPSRPITLIVPLAPGGLSDALCRIVAERMRRSLGQPVIIENVSGADGTIAFGRAARAKPDGYTIFIDSTAVVLSSALYSLPFDGLNDFVPIAPLATLPLVLFASNTVPAKELDELIAWLKTNPDKVSAGFGSLGAHLLTLVFQKETGTKLTLVPYRGAPALNDLVASQIELLFYPTDGLSLARAGSIKAYGVTSDARLASAPDIPTFSEMGLSALSYSPWQGFVAPKGTPRDIIAKIKVAAVEALADPAVRSRLIDLGLEVFSAEQQTPEAFDVLRRRSAEKWWPILKSAGIRAGQ
jgi:tripartite-type tricarboxylate transporter receptor subunit TctC